MKSPTPDERLKNLAGRMRIMTNQINKIIASGVAPDSPTLQPLLDAIDDLAAEIEKIHKTIP